MSKAFTKETDTDDSDDLPEESLPRGIAKNYITPQGHERLKKELHELLYTSRPELVKTVAWAASNGDRSENGDYIYGKRRLREIDRRIRFLTKRLDAAEVIDPTTQKGDRVLFGATVTVLDDDQEKRVYYIVGIDETDPGRGKVSWISPIAKALLSKKAGDLTTLVTPEGEKELEVLSVEYLAIG